MLYPVILCGGSGTRLWPLSREHYPKPLLSLMSEESLLQETFQRLEGLEAASPIIVCNEEHRFLVAEQARQVGRSLASIVLEPEGRNTAPALTLAALVLSDIARRSEADDPIMLVMPADHVIRDASAFQSVVRRGALMAQQGRLVTFGVTPASPKTGYGYIRKGPALDLHSSSNGETDVSHDITPCRIAAFVEKPDQATALAMLETEEYLWNSGIFMMRASVWLEQLERYRPDIAEVCASASAKGEDDGIFFRPAPDLFITCPGDSIDYAVMEKAGGSKNGSSPECVVLPLDVGWSDMGAWSALWEESKQDWQGNVIRGDVLAQSMKNSLLIGQHRLVAAVGLENVIVVETPDAVLVVSKDHVQDVKGLVEQLKRDGRPEHESHRKVHRPWGSYEVVDAGPRFQVKRLTVNPGSALSLQMHHHRAEHWVIVKGTARVTRGDEEFLLAENQSAYVPVGVKHRLENPGSIPLEIIEVQSGSYLGEDDIVRFDDRYNRHKGK